MQVRPLSPGNDRPRDKTRGGEEEERERSLLSWGLTRPGTSDWEMLTAYCCLGLGTVLRALCKIPPLRKSVLVCASSRFPSCLPSPLRSACLRVTWARTGVPCARLWLLHWPDGRSTAHHALQSSSPTLTHQSHRHFTVADLRC